MIKNIPAFQTQRIERNDPFQLPAKEHMSEKENAEVKKRRDQALKKFRSTCAALKASNPKAWDDFTADLFEMYGSCYHLASRSPLDYAAIGYHPEYYSKVTLYAMAQIEILDSFVNTAEIKKPEPLEEKPSILKLFLDFCKKSLALFIHR